MRTSLPPQCGGVPLIGWDWDAVDGEQVANGTTWIDFVEVTGEFDGTTMTVTAVAPIAFDDEPAARYDNLDRFKAPCPEPAGGWLAEGADAPTIGHPPFEQIQAYLDAEPDAGTAWIDQSISANPEANDNRQMIIVVSFAGDPAALPAHETALRAIWPGALCVTTAPVSSRTLRATVAEITAMIGDRGVMTLPGGVELHMLGWSQDGDLQTGTIPFEVEWVPPGAQAYFDEIYGPGVVVLNAQLMPI
jgi:hypothetical protein